MIGNNGHSLLTTHQFRNDKSGRKTKPHGDIGTATHSPNRSAQARKRATGGRLVPTDRAALGPAAACLAARLSAGICSPHGRRAPGKMSRLQAQHHRCPRFEILPQRVRLLVSCQGRCFSVAWQARPGTLRVGGGRNFHVSPGPGRRLVGRGRNVPLRGTVAAGAGRRPGLA